MPRVPKDTNGDFEQEVVDAILAKAPLALVVHDLKVRSGHSRSIFGIDVVAISPPFIYFLEVKNWHGAGKDGSTEGLLHVIDEFGIHHATPDPRVRMRQALGPLIRHRNNLAHGRGGDPQNQGRLDHFLPVFAVIVPDDFSILVPENERSPIPLRQLSSFLSGIEPSQEPVTIDGTELTAWVDEKMRPIPDRQTPDVVKIPFHPSNPVFKRGDSVVPRAAELDMALSSIMRGESVTVLAPRRYGKTSFLLSLRERLAKDGMQTQYVYASGEDDSRKTFESLMKQSGSGKSISLVDEANRAFSESHLQSQFRMAIQGEDKQFVFAADDIESANTLESPLANATRIIRLERFTHAQLKELFAVQLSGQELSQVADAALEFTGGHPGLSQLFGFHYANESADSIEDRIVAAKDRMLTDHCALANYSRSISKSLVDFLIGSELAATEVPEKHREEANSLVRSGFFEWRGWKLCPVGQFAVDSLISVSRDEFTELVPRSKEDVWPGLYSALRSAFSEEEIHSLFELSDVDISVLEDEQSLISHIRDRFGIDSVSEIVRDLLGHKERRRLAENLDIDANHVGKLTDELLKRFRLN